MRFIYRRLLRVKTHNLRTFLFLVAWSLTPLSPWRKARLFETRKLRRRIKTLFLTPQDFTTLWQNPMLFSRPGWFATSHRTRFLSLIKRTPAIDWPDVCSTAHPSPPKSHTATLVTTKTPSKHNTEPRRRHTKGDIIDYARPAPLGSTNTPST